MRNRTFLVARPGPPERERLFSIFGAAAPAPSACERLPFPPLRHSPFDFVAIPRVCAPAVPLAV